jgi:hypothetical protein
MVFPETGNRELHFRVNCNLKPATFKNEYKR